MFCFTSWDTESRAGPAASPATFLRTKVAEEQTNHSHAMQRNWETQGLGGVVFPAERKDWAETSPTQSSTPGHGVGAAASGRQRARRHGPGWPTPRGASHPGQLDHLLTDASGRPGRLRCGRTVTMETGRDSADLGAFAVFFLYRMVSSNDSLEQERILKVFKL